MLAIYLDRLDDILKDPKLLTFKSECKLRTLENDILKNIDPSTKTYNEPKCLGFDGVDALLMQKHSPSANFEVSFEQALKNGQKDLNALI